MRLKTVIHMFVFAAVLALTASYANAQPATPTPAAMAAPAPRPVARPAVRPVATPKPRAVPAPRPVSAMAAPVTVPADAAVSAAPKPVTPAMAVPADVPPASPKAPAPVWKSPGFWISVVGAPVLGVILAILLAFGVIQKKHLQYLKDKQIVKVADKVVNGFESYAAGTEVKWDDAVAQALRAVVTRVGTLTEEQEKLVKDVVAERQEQAEKKAAADLPEEADTPAEKDESKDDEAEKKESKDA